MLKNFYIFRNGQSSYNLAGKLQGQSNDSVLTEQGIMQAFSAANSLKDKKIDVIISSPQRRAKQTGNIVAKQLNKPIRYDSRFAEVNLGSLDGTPLKKISPKNRDILDKWLKKNAVDDTCFQNGERKSALRARILSALNEYANSPYQNIAVSSHNFSIIEALQSMNTSKEHINNGEIIHLQYNGSDWKYIQSLN